MNLIGSLKVESNIYITPVHTSSHTTAQIYPCLCDVYDYLYMYMFIHVEYLSKSERRESESNYDSMGSRDLIGDSFTPPDSSMNDDDDQG